MTKVKIVDWERKKYPLKESEDVEILGKIHELEELPLSVEDKELVDFVRSQLEEDWRTPIFELLEKLLKKYK